MRSDSPVFWELFNQQDSKIKISGCFSSLSVGVPQGPILGPLLFFLHINDMGDTLSLVKPILFSNDADLFYWTCTWYKIPLYCYCKSLDLSIHINHICSKIHKRIGTLRKLVECWIVSQWNCSITQLYFCVYHIVTQFGAKLQWLTHSCRLVTLQDLR